MSDMFEQRLQAGLEALAAQSEAPSPDFYHQVRVRIAARRDRRRAVLAAGIATCAAGLLATALITVSTGPAHVTAPAADRRTAAAPSATPWWQSTAPAAPTALTAFWNAQGSGPHTEVYLLHQGAVGTKTVYLLAGRQPDGEQRLALVSGYPPDAAGTWSWAGLHLITDQPAPTAPRAPIAFSTDAGIGTTPARIVTVMAPPCTGERQLSLGPYGQPLRWQERPPGVLLINTPLEVTDTVTVGCDAPDDSTTYRLATDATDITNGGLASLLTTAPSPQAAHAS
ncbi:hypothetical protein [Kitasatospora sp. HPMI-4]|uniref:hypothetical protein n=1 Tax=Kitasatospora sp. HPMI-4 TaxID=3448443 RepID=UPI003F1A0D94